jgi:ribonuclease PH
VTGGYVALALGLKPLIASGEISPDALKPPIAAVSVGIVQGHPILDLNYAEDSQAEVDLNLVMTSEGQIIEIQGTAEGKPFSRAELDHMLILAEKGIQEVIALQKTVLG